MAKTPPSRSYRLFSGAACFDWAFALSARTNTVNGAAVTASPATTLRLVIKFETVRAMITSRVMGQTRSVAEHVGRGPLGTLLLLNQPRVRYVIPSSLRDCRS